MYLVILQTQSTAGAALEIIVMLLGAAIIGVVTTYFYMKSKYQQTINSLESKLEAAERSKVQLREELADVKNELASVKQELEEKDKESEQLRRQYDELLKKKESTKKTAIKKEGDQQEPI